MTYGRPISLRYIRIRVQQRLHIHYTFIDLLSKYAWAVPLKSKDGSETVEAIA